jgi:two-component system, OmpR family, sensor histidine kinase KdpD
MTRPVRGRLKVFLGYAAGVGKTYQMLVEAQQLRRQGVDVVIGYFEPHGRKDTIAQTEDLEAVPRRSVEYRGAFFPEMDTDAILQRHPAVCLVDELAHTNVPGSERDKRWQDVGVLLDAGIDVLSTVNVQHLESLNDQVRQATGVVVRETVPDWVVDEADEVVFVDLTPQALRNRLERGVVYAPDKASAAMSNFFTERNLGFLREVALRHAAHEVQDRLTPGHPAAADRVLICLTGSPTSAALIRRGKRVADYLRADCLAVHVLPLTAAARELERRRREIDRHLTFARDLHIDVRVIESDDTGAAIADFARAQRISHIFMGRSHPRCWWSRFGETVSERVVRLASDRGVTIVSHHRGS